MALSFKEKREVQKLVAAKIEELKAGNLSFKEKRAAQKELKDAFARLSVKIDQQDPGEAENQKLKDLIAGKFNNLKPLEFIGVLKEIVSDIKDVEPVKPPTIAYCDVNQDKMINDAVMESALREMAGA
jgi:hypothetical protein